MCYIVLPDVLPCVPMEAWAPIPKDHSFSKGLHIAHLTSHTPPLTLHPSHLTLHTSHSTPHTPPLTLHTSHSTLTLLLQTLDHMAVVSKFDKLDMRLMFHVLLRELKVWPAKERYEACARPCLRRYIIIRHSPINEGTLLSDIVPSMKVHYYQT